MDIKTMFNFKKSMMKKIEFIPTDEHAKLFPPKPAKMTLPDWYKNMDSYMSNFDWTAKSLFENNFPSSVLTIKRCIPVQDYILSGYTIFSNTDILLTRYVGENETNQFYWAAPRKREFLFGSHPHSQCPIKFNDQKHDYIKVFCNWIIKTPPGYSCLITQPFYNNEERFTFLPGIVDTDEYDQTIGFIGYLNTNYENIKIEAGTPIINVFPFKRDEWKMKVVDTVLKNEETKLPTLKKQFFENVYRKFYWTKKRFD